MESTSTDVWPNVTFQTWLRSDVTRNFGPLQRLQNNGNMPPSQQSNFTKIEVELDQNNLMFKGRHSRF